MIDHFGIAGDFREIFGEGRLGRRDCNFGDNLSSLRLDSGREIVTMVMPEREIGIDHCHLLTKRAVNKRCHRLHLAFHVCDARLQCIAVQHAAGDMMAL